MTLPTNSVSSTPAPLNNGDAPIVLDANPTATSPVVESSAPPAAQPNGGEPPPAAEPTPATGANTEPPAQKTTPEWAQKRINELTAKRYEAERLAEEAVNARKAAESRAAELLAQLEKNKTGGVGTDPAQDPSKVAPKSLSEEEVERRATEKAALIARANEFNKACNTIVEVGKKEYKESWDEAVKNLNMVGAIGKDVSPVFLENAVELKDPHKVLHYLGTNIEEGARIAQLPPTRMAIELARVEAALSAPPVEPKPIISNAPAPVIPVGGQAKSAAPPSLEDPNISPEEWYALRAKQIEEKKRKYMR